MLRQTWQWFMGIKKIFVENSVDILKNQICWQTYLSRILLFCFLSCSCSSLCRSPLNVLTYVTSLKNSVYFGQTWVHKVFISSYKNNWKGLIKKLIPSSTGISSDEEFLLWSQSKNSNFYTSVIFQI